MRWNTCRHSINTHLLVACLCKQSMGSSPYCRHSSILEVTKLPAFWIIFRACTNSGYLVFFLSPFGGGTDIMPCHHIQIDLVIPLVVPISVVSASTPPTSTPPPTSTLPHLLSSHTFPPLPHLLSNSSQINSTPSLTESIFILVFHNLQLCTYVALSCTM